MLNSKRGAGLVDALVSILLLGVAGAVFAASFPTGFCALHQSSEATNAVSMAQQKVEQIRSLEYDKLNYSDLYTAGFIDMYPQSSPYSFTSVDNVEAGLIDGTGVLTITDETGGKKRVVVSVSWKSGNGIARNVTLTTLVADMSPLVK